MIFLVFLNIFRNVLWKGLAKRLSIPTANFKAAKRRSVFRLGKGLISPACMCMYVCNILTILSTFNKKKFFSLWPPY